MTLSTSLSSIPITIIKQNTMFDQTLTHQFFPGLQDYHKHGNRHTANFVNDQTLQLHVPREQMNSLIKTEQLLTTLKEGEYVLWVDDVYSPYEGHKAPALQNKPEIVVVARSVRAVSDAFEKLGHPKIIYLDYNLDEWTPRATGIEVIFEITYNHDSTNAKHTPIMVPISSEKNLNDVLQTTWNECISKTEQKRSINWNRK